MTCVSREYMIACLILAMGGDDSRLVSSGTDRSDPPSVRWEVWSLPNVTSSTSPAPARKNNLFFFVKGKMYSLPKLSGVSYTSSWAPPTFNQPWIKRRSYHLAKFSFYYLLISGVERVHGQHSGCCSTPSPPSTLKRNGSDTKISPSVYWLQFLLYLCSSNHSTV